MNFLNNFIKIKAEISNLSKNVNLIVITKNQDFMNIKPIIDQGHLHFGENRVQDALAKWESYLKLNNKINLHFVGKLQSNKIKQAISLFNYIHSLDSEKLAIALHKEETFSGKKIKYFIQVNIGGEVQKSGVLKSELSTFLNFCKNNTRLDIIGLMCIPPNDDKSLKYFKEIKQLANEFNFSQTSMGMSQDYKDAILCGATFVRIGSSIYA
jgi:pyridoxal phosphate enzyme (YggS family)